VPALRGIDLAIAAGEVVAVVGPNGAGKTTLLCAISGSVPVAAGTIAFNGADITGLPPWTIATQGIAHVPQGRRCFAALTVEENLILGGYRLAGNRQAAKLSEIYDMFPVLRTKRRDQAATLSGGQQQMLAIGRGLMSEPRLLLLDEPSLGLSPLLVQEMAQTLRRLADQVKVSIVLAEQNTRLALRVSSRAYVLQGGACVHQGASDEIAPNLHAAYLGSSA
jgi:branched-chain amino acid transport system ATP-binding protein